MAFVALFIVTILVISLFTSIWMRLNKPIVSKYDVRKQMLNISDYPLVGAALRFLGSGEDAYAAAMNIADTHRENGMVTFDLGIEQWLVIYKAEYVQSILGSSKHLDKQAAYDYLHPWLRYGLLTSTGKKWAARRKMLTPAFHYNILNDFIVVFNEHASILCEKLEERIGQGEFDICPYITLCALDIICETAMGEHINAQRSSSSDYVNALHDICEILVMRQKSPWLTPNLCFYLSGYGRHFDKGLKIIHGFTKSVIENRQKKYDETEAKVMEEDAGESDDSHIYIKKKRRAFLDLLLYNWQQGNLTTEDIQEEVDTFMFEGHDTTSAGMMWAIYMIISHPDVYEKVNQEIDEVFGDSDRPALSEDLKKLDYLEMAIKESMRLYPSVPIIGRSTTEDIEIGDYKIPKGQMTTLLIGALHRDPYVFPDPSVYNPDRFLPENIAERHAYAFVPFSAGRRNCIGQKFAMSEEKTLLSSIFRRFRLETTQKESEAHPEMGLVLRPRYGIRVKVTKR